MKANFLSFLISWGVWPSDACDREAECKENEGRTVVFSHNKRQKPKKMVGMSQISHSCCKNFESVLCNLKTLKQLFRTVIQRTLVTQHSGRSRKTCSQVH